MKKVMIFLASALLLLSTCAVGFAADYNVDAVLTRYNGGVEQTYVYLTPVAGGSSITVQLDPVSDAFVNRAMAALLTAQSLGSSVSPCGWGASGMTCLKVNSN